MQQKIKTKDAYKENFLKVSFIRLQSDIVESVAWPSLTTELIFIVIRAIQILKYPFDYTSSNWNDPQDSSLRVLFSYLDPSWYLNYLGEAAYMNVLYLVLSILGLYILGYCYLLKSAHVPDSNGFIKRIMKGMLTLFMTILYVPLAKTIIMHQNCSRSVQDSYMFPCLVKQPNLAVTIVSLVVLVTFTALLCLQSVTSFQFLPAEQPRIIRHSSRSTCLWIIIIFFNEIAAVRLDSLTFLIILNVECLIMSVYILLVDEYVTISARKFEHTIVILTFWLTLFADVNQFTDFVAPLILWGATSFIIVVGVWFRSEITIKSELENINKWTTPADMLKYCWGLRQLLAQAVFDSTAKMKVDGYVDIHLQKCEESSCPIRTTPAGVRKLRDFHPRSTNNKTDEVVLIEELIKKIYSQGVKFFPTNSALEVEYATFLYLRGMPQQALKELLQVDVEDPSFDQYYKYHRLKHLIHRQLSVENSNKALDMLSELEMNKKEEEFFKLLEKTALVDLQFWGVLNEDHPDFLKLDQIGINRIRLGEEVEKLYKEISDIGNSQRTTFLYILFLISVNKHEQEFSEIQTTVSKNFSLHKKITIEDWANSSDPIFLFNGDEDKFGNIADLNLTAASCLGYEKYELVNRNLSMLLSPLSSSNDFLSNEDLLFYLIKKNGYCLLVHRKLQVFNSMSRGFIYMCTITIQKLSSQGLIMTNNNGKVEAMTPACISLLGIDLKFTNHRETTESIFSNRLSSPSEFSVGKVIKLKQMYSEDVIEKLNFSDDMLNSKLEVKIKPLNGKGLIYSFEPTDIRHVEPVNAAPTISDFAFGYKMEEGLVFTGERVQGLMSLDQLPQTEIKDQEIEEMVFKETKAFGEGIRIVRLYDNQIEVIEEEDSSEAFEQARTSNIMIDQFLKLSRKDQEQIFASKENLLEFIEGYEVGRCLKMCLLICYALHLVLFIAVYILFSSHNLATIPVYKDLTLETLKLGEVQVLLSCTMAYEQLANNASNQTISEVSNQMAASITRLQDLKTSGLKGYPLSISMSDGSTQTFYSDQFLESYLNNAQLVNSNYGSADTLGPGPHNTSNTQMSSLYIRNNGLQVYPQVVNALENKVKTVTTDLNANQTVEVILLLICYSFEIVFTVIVLYLFCSVYQEKIKVLKIFLCIPEQQILLFSSKSERFLTSLHVEDNEGEDDEEILNDDKGKHTFAVKKKFKLIKQQKGVYFKFLLVPLLVQIYYVVSFVLSHGNLDFMKSGLVYANQTSSAKRIFYNGLSQMQAHLVSNAPVVQPSSAFINYYESYFQNHYLTFSRQNDFHLYFIKVQMMDICQGGVKVPDACNLDLATNGTLLLFTDMTVYTAYLSMDSDFKAEYYTLYKVITASHELLNARLLDTQHQAVSRTNQYLVNYLFIFLIGSLAVFVFYATPMVSDYLEKINNTKKMLGLLPLSIARQSDEIHNYFQEIVDKKKFCFN